MCLVDAVYAMAHSLHNLVLDLCCNNTHLFNDQEEALQVNSQTDNYLESACCHSCDSATWYLTLHMFNAT
jgi:hypothetical protein